MLSTQNEYSPTLYNKYRPHLLSEIVGQSVTVRIFSNFFAKISETAYFPSAILLSGPYGTGKTSLARILALGLNCNQGPTAIPCLTCSNCLGILAGSNCDVIEIDAASNSDVDNIRRLQENCRYAPSNSAFKIYIIDEAHMLSTSAFNALLKILEEPFNHIKFILATTEVEKITKTIVSRCVHFTLERINAYEISKHLKLIASKENMQITEGGLEVIAKASNHSMRDALSLLEKVAAYGNNKDITVEIVKKALGIYPIENLNKLLTSILAGHTLAVLNDLEQLYMKGEDCINIIQQLLILIHQHTVFFLKGNENIAEAQEAYESISSTSTVNLLKLWRLLKEGIQEVKNAITPYTSAEMLLIRASYLFIVEDSIATSEETKLSNILYDEEKIKNLFKEREEYIYKYLCSNIKFSSINRNVITLQALTKLSDDFITKFNTLLNKWTKQEWEVNLQNDLKDFTTQEDELYREIREYFPSAKLINVQKKNLV